MTYAAIADMTQSLSLQQRIAAAAAAEGEQVPSKWAIENVWAVVSQPGWDEAWTYALDNQTLDNNPDTGIRPGVINDEMILAGVQAVRAATP